MEEGEGGPEQPPRQNTNNATSSWASHPTGSALPSPPPSTHSSPESRDTQQAKHGDVPAAAHAELCLVQRQTDDGGDEGPVREHVLEVNVRGHVSHTRAAAEDGVSVKPADDGDPLVLEDLREREEEEMQKKEWVWGGHFT